EAHCSPARHRRVDPAAARGLRRVRGDLIGCRGRRRREDRRADGPRNDRHVAARRWVEVPLIGGMDRPDRRGRRARHAHQLLVSKEIARAVETLRAGGLVAFPTETVYGLGADASNPSALRRLYAVKRRPVDHPVIVHVGTAEQLDDLAADVPDVARVLARSCWPGPLTLVVRRRPGALAEEATGGRGTVGIR